MKLAIMRSPGNEVNTIAANGKESHIMDLDHLRMGLMEKILESGISQTTFYTISVS